MSNGYEQEFLKNYRQLSSPTSSYYKFGYQQLLDNLNASTPTLGTLTGAQMAQGGSYKGSSIIGNQQRQAAETRNATTARKGFLDMYMGGRSMAQGYLQGAQKAYQYEDQKPSFWEEVGGYGLGALTQSIMPGVGGFLSGAVDNLFGGGQQQQGTNNPYQGLWSGGR